MTRIPGMVWQRERLFAVLLPNASSAANDFRPPGDRTVDLGMVVQL